MKRFLMAALVGATALSTAHADSHKGWTIGAAAAFSDFSDDAGLIDDSSVGFKVSAGYRFNKYLGLEGAYLNTSEWEGTTSPNDPSGETLKLSSSGFTGHVIGYIPVPMEDLTPFVKLGFFDFNRDLSLAGDVVSSGKDDGFAAGIGTFIKIHDDWDIRAEFDWYDAESADFWTVNLGIQYRFGGSR
jgi:opacity protein-like surface antigen